MLPYKLERTCCWYCARALQIRGADGTEASYPAIAQMVDSTHLSAQSQGWRPCKQTENGRIRLKGLF
jgi:hypothetical protein